jgi:ATP-dependent Lon protease
MSNNSNITKKALDRDQRVDQKVKIPEELPILPLRNTVAFPYSVLPLAVGVPRSVKLIEDAMQGDHLIGLVSMKYPEIEEPQPGQVYEVGTVAKVERVMRSPDNTLQIIVQGIQRIKIDYWTTDKPYLRAHITLAPDVVEEDLEMEALQRSLRNLAKEVVKLSPNIPAEATDFLNQIKDPLYLAYLVAGNAGLEIAKGQEILETNSARDKLRALIKHLSREKEVLSLGKKIQSEAREEMDKAQREYYLRQQLKAIQKELGESEEGQAEIDEYAEKFEKADMPEEAQKEAQRELKRFKGMSPHSAEYSVIKTYLDWLIELPWNKTSEDQTDIARARTVLDQDHYDLEEVKERIIEYLAVRTLVNERGVQPKPGDEGTTTEAMGAILCFAGPPGVGKTSLGKSIARALGRKFTRMSLGGMRDEAEIRGHRRTYIGAMPGRIIQAIKRAGTRNPVFMLDEVDKIGVDWRGDPSSALLEVLDPAQNHAFRDYYLDVDFDLSDVIFITTANQLETIPPPLRDRMEIIQLDGYTEYEKVQIAQRHLVPRQLKAHGLREEEITFTEEALRKIVQDYTREAGVRNLERQVGAISRKSVVKIAAQEWSHVVVTPELVREYLKKEKFESESSENIEIPGIATGLAVTSVGGDILFIEATRMIGKGKLTLTGQLGDVMRESAQIAHSYVRSKADQLKVDPDQFEKTDVHLHVPSGAVPKDGPSAGIAMVMAVASLFSGQPVRGDVGMTGEVTLRGRVLPVGGIKMKVLAAHRAGLTTVILPKRNEKDLDDLPDEVRNTMLFVLVDHIDEALKVVFFPDEEQPEIATAIKA